MYSSNESLKLYVGDLGGNRRSDLQRLFSKYGEISQIYFDERKHFAFIEFTSLNDAQRALQKTNNRIVNGSKLRVEYAKSSRHDRHLSSREPSPRTVLYNHLQVTANRLPPMQAFRQNYSHHNLPNRIENSSITTRGRSMTPPSLKHKSYHPPSRSQDFYNRDHHSSSNAYGDPYTMQRLPPSAFLSSCADRHREYPSTLQHHAKRSRSRDDRRRISPSHKRKRQSSSPPPNIQRGPRTPSPLSHCSTQRSRKRSRSNSNAIMSSSASEEDRSSSKKSSKENSTRKYTSKKI